MLDPWHKNAIVYSLDVKTFQDSNGDGMGDFEGLTGKLDYISGINATCIWLLPFYCSPDRDNGYDVSDYYSVDPRLGTLGDFVEFAHQARERGIRVLADLVVNHTSIDHPWFQAARRDPDSIYRDYYVWSKQRPPDANEGMVFPGVQDSVWTYDDVAKEWYFHRFYDHEPDLNTANPRVREEISKIMGFWLQLGVSGFRVDAAPFLLEMDGPKAPSQKDADALLRELRNYLSWRRGDAVMLAEANVTPESVSTYFGTGDKVQLLFNFMSNQHLFLALANGKAGPIRQVHEELPGIPDTCQWANFLRNHDELDLGRLTDEQRKRVYEKFAPDPGMRLYDRGIRRRLAPMLRDRGLIELAWSLMCSLPGTPVIWYGEEIGMGDDLSLPERNSVRTPMQWLDGYNAGFSQAPPDRLVRPIVADEAFGCDQVNVKEQQRDPASLLNWVERLLRVPRRSPEFGWGECRFLDSGNPAVLVQRSEFRGSRALAIHNLGNRSVKVEVPLSPGVVYLEDLLTDNRVSAEGGNRHRIELRPHGYRWFREGDSSRT
jgi:maltose alpha-D-glucosyltransferase / alpha-amylase